MVTKAAVSDEASFDMLTRVFKVGFYAQTWGRPY
jgi:hypothetical protein